MKKFKPWEDLLLSLVGRGLQKHGFASRPQRQSFSKNCPFGWIKFHLAFIEHQDDFDVTGDVGIRFDRVEELLNLDDKLVTKPELAETCTVGCELGNLSEGRQQRWTVLTGDDVPVVSDAIIAAFTDVGLPYVDRFSDAAHVLNVLSGDGPDSWRQSPLHGARAKRAVAMALMTQGMLSAQCLAKLKESFLEERRDFGLASFRAFLNKIGLG